MRRTLAVGVLALAATAGSAGTAAARDVNHDRIPDRWEHRYHLDLHVNQANRDQDHDGLKNRSEWRDHTSPRKRDSDGDGIPDPREDSNHDGVTNVAEQHGDHPGPADGTNTPGDTPHTGDPAATAAVGHLVSYSQSAGFGGYLVIERANGEQVTAYLGEKTDLECAPAASAEPQFTPCTKDHLVPGAGIARAEHGSNGHADVWTKVFLLVGDAPPAPPAPAGDNPAPQTVGGTVVSYEQSSGFGGTLTIMRPGGESVSAWYGDGTDLRCAPTSAGPFTACTKDQLQAGRASTDARHAVNLGGHDVWSRVYLVVPAS